MKYATIEYLYEEYYEQTLSVINTLKLKIKIAKKFIYGDTLIINDNSSIIGRLISDGIEVENHPSLNYAAVEYLCEKNYEKTLPVINTLKLKIKIRKNFIDGDTLIINDDSSIIGRLISDGIEVENYPLLKYATIRYLNCLLYTSPSPRDS